MRWLSKIFNHSPYQKFAHACLPLLKILAEETKSLSEFCLWHNTDYLTHTRVLLEQCYQVRSGIFPESVYRAGYNRKLSAGYRFFLIQCERMIDLYFSINYLIQLPLLEELRHKISPVIATALLNNQKLFHLLIHFFETQQIDNNQVDWIEDIRELENALQMIVPQNIELLSVSADYLHLTLLVRDIKDLRGVLIKCVASLPVA